jgi:hypothetical protein
MGFPQVEHADVEDGAGPARVPHCGQKGRAGSIVAPHPGHCLNATPFGCEPGATRVSGMSFFFGPAGPSATARAPADESFRSEATSMTRAPPDTMGLPQSMQNRDSSSLSRPQKPHGFKGSILRGHSALNDANIDRDSGSG